MENRITTPSASQALSADVSPPRGSFFERLGWFLTMLASLSAQGVALYLVASTWSQTQSAWITNDRWAPHAANAFLLLALASPTAFVLALKMGARWFDRRK